MSFRFLTVRGLGFSGLFFASTVLCLLSATSAQTYPKEAFSRLNLRTQGENAPAGLSSGDWQQLAKITPDKGEVAFYFGNSVAISGDTVVVAGNPAGSEIAGFVFVKPAEGWANAAPAGGLKIPDSNVFFVYVAIDGDTIVIGAPSLNPAEPSYAYVFVKPAGGWKNMTPTATLAPSDTMDGLFGRSVSIQGNTIAVGDFGSDSPGVVYVYTTPAGGWQNMTQTAKLTASDGMPNDDLGLSVSVHGTTIAAGAPQTTEYNLSGKAYVFVQPAGGWTNMTQTAELTVPTAVEGSNIGFSIFTNDDWVVAGAPSFENDGFAGFAYIFSKPASGWSNVTATATLTPSDSRPYSQFGVSVSGSGKIAVVGSPRRGAPPFGVEGGVYVFTESASGWQNMAGRTVLTGSDARNYVYLGTSVAMGGNVVITGEQDPYSTTGAAYVFGLP
jgi:hypothetical protein